MFSFLFLVSLFTFAKAVSQVTSNSDCIGTIKSLDDVSRAVMCVEINIYGFTVPAGVEFSLSLLPNTVINVLGNIMFGKASWSGPLLVIEGENITFNGNGYSWDGGGPFYWDGKGENGDRKPTTFLYFRASGGLYNLRAVNCPLRGIAVNNIGPLTISGVTIDDSQGDYPNSKSNGQPAGRNTDGFDISGNDVRIENCTVYNQDDCITIDSGKNITLVDNTCQRGHGISIGSIGSDTIVEDVNIEYNQIDDSKYGLRIKTQQHATNSRVTNVAYVGNTVKNCTDFGVSIDQGYSNGREYGTPERGVIISRIKFVLPETSVNVEENAISVGINCGNGSCIGPWNWSGLQTSGGKIGEIRNAPTIIGFTL